MLQTMLHVAVLNVSMHVHMQVVQLAANELDEYAATGDDMAVLGGLLCIRATAVMDHA